MAKKLDSLNYSLKRVLPIMPIFKRNYALYLFQCKCKKGKMHEVK